jgi:WD40 repeat protein
LNRLHSPGRPATIGCGSEDPHLGEGELLRDCAGRNGPAERVVFAPDGSTVAATYTDGAVRLFDVATGKETITLKALPFAPPFSLGTASPAGKPVGVGSPAMFAAAEKRAKKPCPPT